MHPQRSSSFDDVIDRLFRLNGAPYVEPKRVEVAVSTACQRLDRIHAIYVAAGDIESAPEVLAILDARTRLLAAAEGDRVSLHCDVLVDAATEEYGKTLAQMSPLIERTLQATLGEAWSAASSPFEDVDDLDVDDEHERPTQPTWS